MNNIVTTNLRMPTEDWMQVKTMAEEMGMSFNGYINWIAKETMNSVAITGKPTISKKKLDLRDLSNVMKKFKDKPMGASEDDKIIYGIED